MADFLPLFGSSLISKDGPVSTTSLAGKTVAVYFSAHWCGPCKAFTPKLRQIYLNLKKSGKPFEVIFCSSDNDAPSFKEYFGSMPWLAVPFESKDVIDNLKEMFAVQGIPRVVVLNEGGILNPNARADIMENPEGFPWKQPTIKELIGSTLMKGDKVVGASALEGMYFGLYFSAHWCGPCKQFTPKLIECYNELKKLGKNFEVVFCSSDNDENEYKGYYGSMPWLTLGYRSPIKEKLSTQLNVEGIPTFILCDLEGNVVNGEGRAAIEEGGAAAFPWIPDVMKNLNTQPDNINSGPCFVLFNEDNVESATAAAKEMANGFRNEKVYFFYADHDGGVSSQIRGMVPSKERPYMCIVDLPDNGGYYKPKTQAFTVEAMTAFVKEYLAEKITREQLGE